jgi:hypothetical protein
MTSPARPLSTALIMNMPKLCASANVVDGITRSFQAPTSGP